MTKEANSENEANLTEEQKATKTEIFKEITQLLNDHARWQLGKKDDGQLTWQKLKPLLFSFITEGLGVLGLERCNLSRANFEGAAFPPGTSFAKSLLGSTSFAGARFSYVDFSGAPLADCRFSTSNIYNCNFSNTYSIDAWFCGSSLIDCNFNGSDMRDASFRFAFLNKSKFCDAELIGANFEGCKSAVKTDFSGANLSHAMLNNANFSNSILTGVNLYGTARTDWNIDGVECKYVFWDKDGKERFPPKRDFTDGEFTTLYKPYKEFSYVFENGITPFELALASHLVEEINKSNIGVEVRIDNASLRGENPTLNFIILSGSNVGFQISELFKIVFEQKLSRLEEQFQKKRYSLPAEDPSKNDSALSIPQRVSRQLLAPITENQYEDKALIVRTTGELQLQNLGSNNLDEYDYLAFFSLGKNTKGISQEELDWICVDLSKAMPPKCLLSSDKQLDETPKNAFARSAYNDFNKCPKHSFIAIIAITRGINENLYRKPVYCALTLKPENDFLRSIESFKNSLKYKSIADFKLRALHPKQESMFYPNSELIKALREAEGSREAVSKVHFKNSNRKGGLTHLSESSLKRAEGSIPVQGSVMDDIACFLKKSINELTFKEVVPNLEELREWQNKTGLSTEELAMRFGVSPCFFGYMEREKIIPAATLIDVYNHYNRLFKDLKNIFKRPFKSLIDPDKTKALKQKHL